MFALILNIVTATFLAPTAAQRDTAILRTAADESAAKIKDLQKERIATLKELVEVSARLYQIARAPYEEVLDAQVLLLKAELEAAEKESERIALYKNFVDVLKSYEKIALAQKEAGRGTNTAVLKFKARRLEAEIHLEQARAKGAREGK